MLQTNISDMLKKISIHCLAYISKVYFPHALLPSLVNSFVLSMYASTDDHTHFLMGNREKTVAQCFDEVETM